MNEKKEVKKPIFKQWWFWVATVVVLIIGVAASSGDGGDKSDAPDEDQTQSETVTEESNSPNETKESHTVSEHAAEVHCQDASFIGNFINLRDIDIIWMTNYNKEFYDYDSGATGYDKDGNEVVSLIWNGKHKVSGQQIRFSCWLSGSSDDKRDITLHWFSIDGQDFVGSAAFEHYNKDGTRWY